MYYHKFQTDLCSVILIGDEEGLRRIHLSTDYDISGLIANKKIFEEAEKQLIEYFNGQRRHFDLKLNLVGTNFQKTVWQALMDIPYGQTASYKDIAVKLGKPTASRAVGMANGKNPLPLVIPCHRIIGSGGKLTGYAFGLELKEALLNLENRL